MKDPDIISLYRSVSKNAFLNRLPKISIFNVEHGAAQTVINYTDHDIRFDLNYHIRVDGDVIRNNLLHKNPRYLIAYHLKSNVNVIYFDIKNQTSSALIPRFYALRNFIPATMSDCEGIFQSAKKYKASQILGKATQSQNSPFYKLPIEVISIFAEKMILV